MRKILKTTSIVLFTTAFLAGSVVLPFLGSAAANATKQPAYKLQVRNVSQSGTFEGAANSVNLAAGEVAQLRMQVGNVEEGNDISSLRFKAFFNDQVNPTEFHADIKADELPWVGGAVSVSVPNSYFLEYIPGSTVLDKDDRPEFFTRTNVDDINGTSPVAFNDGMDVTNVGSGPHTWLWVYFKVKATEQKPIVINPRLDLTKFVANISKGETFADKRTETTADPGNTLMVQIVVKNGVAESTLHNVAIKDQKPQGAATPQSLTATASSDEATKDGQIKININETQEINVVRGSVVLKDLYDNTLKTLSDAEADQLFSTGLLLGEIHGTFEYAKAIEFKAKVSTVLGPPELPKTGAGAVLLLVFASAPVGLALRTLRRKI